MFYRIADFPLEIVFAEGGRNDESLIPSFSVFKESKNDAVETSDAQSAEPLLFRFLIDDSLAPLRENRERIKEIDTGNGITVIDRFPDGSYQFIIKDILGRDCTLLQTNSDFSVCRCALNGNFAMRNYGLNNALMLAFAFAGCHHEALLIHASLVRQNGWGYAFIAKSGTGKSTQVSNWLRFIPGCDLMNDDNPIIRIIHGAAWLYGSPWSGKTPCYRDLKAPLGAITVIDRAPENSIDRLSPIEAFVKILPSCSSMKWDKSIYGNTCNNIIKLIESCNNNYILHCRPDDEAAIVCHNAIAHDTSKDS